MCNVFRTGRSKNLKLGTQSEHEVCIIDMRRDLQGQRSRSPGRLMVRPEVHHSFLTERPVNLKHGRQMEYEDEDPYRSTSAMTSKVKGQGRKVTYRPSDTVVGP